jgi:urease accessory protein
MSRPTPDTAIVLTQSVPDASSVRPLLTLALTAEERQRSRHRFTADSGETVFLRLPRGTVLRDGDRLTDEAQTQVVEIRAKAEPVLTVTADTPLALLRAAYHLGNRHVPLEVAPDYLRLSPDPVLEEMLRQLGVEVRSQTTPFQPETGAYGHSGHHH